MKKWGLGIIAVIMATWLIGCGKAQDKKEATGGGGSTLQADASMVVSAWPVILKTIERQVEATGAIAPWDEVTVSNEAPGIVMRIHADLGDTVKKGDTLAMLDQREAELNLEDAEAQLLTSVNSLEKDRAKLLDQDANLRRYEELFRANMVSESQFDSVKTQHDVAKASVKESEARVGQARARLNLAKKRLSDTVIKAPISGEVARRLVSVGEALKDKASLFKIVDSRVLKFKGSVSESQSAKVSAGQAISVAVDALRDASFPGIVKRISPAIDASTRTLEIEAVIPNDKGLLKPGYFAKGRITTETEKDVAFVPAEAVYTLAGVQKVFVIEGDTAHEMTIKTGLKMGREIEAVSEGKALKQGDLVATGGLEKLFQGAKVRVRE
jgi:RND family efflux transporter MFP subunit